MGNLTKELINAFNLNNYACDKISTNFTVEGKKIVGLFASGTNIKEYLRRIEKEIIERHYSGAEVASRYYNLNYFPFVLGANVDKEDLGNGIVKVKLADSKNSEVIRNLKMHFVNEFERAVIQKVVVCLKTIGITEEGAYEWIKRTVGTGAIGSPYLYCIAFDSGYLKKEYDLETFEVFKSLYISEFNSRLEACGLKSSDFYEYKDDMLCIKNINDKVVKIVAEYVNKEVALDFRTPGSVESKVENCKNVLNDIILRSTGKCIDGYDYDVFTDKRKIQNGNNFVLIPLVRMGDYLQSLNSDDARKIDNIFYTGIIPNGCCISDIRGKTQNPQYANSKGTVYAFSNKQIALLLPKIMESPIAYNERNGHFEFVVDLENFRRRISIRGSSQSSSTVTSPTHESKPEPHLSPEPPRTPPEQTGARFFESQEDRDSGYDSNSPPRPKDSAAYSPISDGPSSSLKHAQVQPTYSHENHVGGSPRQGQESEQKQVLHYPINPVDVPGTSGEDKSVQGAHGELLAHPAFGGSKRPLSVHSKDSGYNSLGGQESQQFTGPDSSQQPQSLPLAKDTSGTSKKQGIFGRFLRQLLIRHSKSSYAKGKTTKDILQFDEETCSSFSSGMQKILSLPLSPGMIRNLCQVLPEKQVELAPLSPPKGAKKTHSSSKKFEQLFSSLPPEEQEICSLLFFSEKKEEICADLSPDAKEQMNLFWNIISTRSKDSGGFLRDESRSSVSSSPSNGSVSSVKYGEDIKTKMDSPKTEQPFSNEEVVGVSH